MSDQELTLAAAAVRSGQLIVIPTDTLYGIAADPHSSEAVRALLHAKGRGETMPPPVLAASTAEALSYADWSKVKKGAQLAAYSQAIADRYWPGPLTLIIPTSTAFGWEMGIHGPTVAVRVPDDEVTRELLRATGPLAVTSANRTGEPPALSVEAARNYFGDRVRHYVDGGRAVAGVASTILDCSVWPVRVLREGTLDCEGLLEYEEGINGISPAK